MDAVTLTVAFKGFGMLALIAGGILVAHYGFRLYKDGAGAGRDKTVIAAGPIKLTAHSVGSVVMGTAFLWAWAGVAVSPSLDKKGDDIRVYSLKTPDLQLESQAFAARLSRPAASVQTDPKRLEALFAETVEKTQEKHPEGVAELQGIRATYDPSSLKVTMGAGGTYRVTARLHAGDQSALVAFEPKVKDNLVVFVPESAQKAQ